MFSALLMAGIAVAAQTGPPPADASLAAKVRKLVRQLDAYEAQDRREAEKALLEMGPDVLEHLPEVDAEKSPQAAHSLELVRQQLERRLAEKTAAASTITLTAGSTDVAGALAQIARQSGNPIRLGEDVPEEIKSRPVQAGFQGTPFWQAFDRVVDEAGLAVYPYAEGPGLTVTVRPESVLPRSRGATYVGPFRIAPLRVSAHRELNRTTGDHLLLVLEAAWEPRVRPVVLKQPMAAVKAASAQGVALRVESPEAEYAVPVNEGQSATEFELRFALPPPGTSRIQRLAGRFETVLPGKMQEFRFTDLADAREVQVRKAGATVTLRRVRQNNQIWQVYVVVGYDEAGEALESHYGWFYGNKAYLVGRDGKPVESGGMETFRRTPTEIGLLYNFFIEKPIEEYAFVYEAPGLLLTKEYAYEVKDVELP